MNYTHKDSDMWRWYLAWPSDSQEIEDLIMTQYQHEANTIFPIHAPKMRMEAEIDMIKQRHNLGAAQVIVAKHNDTNKIMAWAWIQRGHYTPYSNSEYADAKMLHIDLNLPVKTRIVLTHQILENWMLWCQLNYIPTLVSTSMREDWKTFMKIHERLGFIVRGTIAWKRIEL